MACRLTQLFKQNSKSFAQHMFFCLYRIKPVLAAEHKIPVLHKAGSRVCLELLQSLSGVNTLQIMEALSLVSR
jgi:hypothetical protein